MARKATVRPIEMRDRAAWAPLWDGYNAFYERAGPTALPAEVTETTWARFFDAYEPVYALVAETEDGRLVGLVHYLFHRSTTSIGPICYLQDLFTDAAARGMGVGAALVEAVYERARAAGCGRVYWQTHETNARAMRLYDQVATKSGFLVYRKAL
jgi:GNAT superfamily N-acetyltransferase